MPTNNQSRVAYEFRLLHLASEIHTAKTELDLALASKKKSLIKFKKERLNKLELSLSKLNLEMKAYLNSLQKLKPTEVNNEPWLSVVNPNLKRATIDPNFIGKWVVFRSISEIDHFWEKVKDLTVKGELGISAKSSTMFQTGQYDPNVKVVCVYTADYRKKDELVLIREKLKSIGVSEVIGYKTDQATKDGIYNSENEFLIKI